MTVVTTRPNATVSSSGFSNTGGGSRHGATSDDSDSTYITGAATAEQTVLGCGEPTIPSGGRVTRYGVRLRTAKVGTNPRLTVGLYDLDASGNLVAVASGVLYPTWTDPATLTVAVAAYTRTPSDVRVLLYSNTEDDVRVHEVYVDTTYVAKPVTAPSAPTGTITTSNLPQVAWVNTLDADGGAQTAYEVKVFTAAQYGAGGFSPDSSAPTTQSGVTASDSLSWTPIVALANATYRAYVRVGQTVNGTTHWSDWAYTGFSVSVTAPNAPAITATLDDANGRITVALDDSATGPSTDLFELQRTTDAGATWVAVRTLDTGLFKDTPTAAIGYAIPASGLATVHDYEAPLGSTVQYRARALHDYGDYAASSWATSTPVTSASTQWWLKDPVSPALNVAVTLDGLGQIDQRARQALHHPLGATFPIAITDTRSPAAGTMKAWVANSSDRAKLDAILSTGRVLFLDGPAANYWPGRYIAVGDHASTRTPDKAWIADTIDDVAWTQVANPDGYVTAWP